MEQLLTEELLGSKLLAANSNLFAAWRDNERSKRQELKVEEEEAPTSPLNSLISSNRWVKSETLRAKSVQSFLKEPKNPTLEIRITSWTSRSGVWTGFSPTPAAVVCPPPAMM